ncbi:uncharacterized protein LOC106669047 isoform X2 [Cimex lectularius]|uniref:Odorant binding protein n=1 Tax=Cimex lectularius TaxID=79782 RepID=A0A8I6RYT0_CIMLE|nr:uncharacterized protein LOC106669047 isoform X2 [Cimex lectularius]
MSFRSMFILSGCLFLLHEIHSRGIDENKTHFLQDLGKVDELQKPTKTMNATDENQQFETRNCIFRVEEDDHLISMNKTREEIESEGKKIFDEICEGDLDSNGDRISSGALASLCCG